MVQQAKPYPQISFLDDQMDSVTSGKKTETLRLGEDFADGGIIELTRQDGTPEGYLKIVFKDEVRFDHLTEIDAKTHGWASLEELKNRLYFIYREIQDETLLTRYRFRYAQSPSEL